MYQYLQNPVFLAPLELNPRNSLQNKPGKTQQLRPNPGACQRQRDHHRRQLRHKRQRLLLKLRNGLKNRNSQTDEEADQENRCRGR